MPLCEILNDTNVMDASVWDTYWDIIVMNTSVWDTYWDINVMATPVWDIQRHECNGCLCVRY